MPKKTIKHEAHYFGSDPNLGFLLKADQNAGFFLNADLLPSGSKNWRQLNTYTAQYFYLAAKVTERI